MEEKIFRKVVLTEGFLNLWQKFPSTIAEVRERIVGHCESGLWDTMMTIDVVA